MNKSIQDLTTRHGEQDAVDLQLLQRVANKDRKAFEQLYSRQYPQLNRYLNRLLRRPEMMEEVLNDAMFVVWEKAARFEGRSKVSTWITGIAYLKGIKALDRVKNMPEQSAENLADAEDIEENVNLISRLGLQDWLRAALEQISADQRSVVELAFFRVIPTRRSQS